MFTINIQAPELANAIMALAAALNGKQIHTSITMDGAEIAKAVHQEVNSQQAVPVQQVSQQTNVVPLHQQQPTQVPNTVPVQQPQVQQQAPVQQTPIQHQPVQQQPQTVPTTAPGYTMDQLAVAATQLMDAGRQQELLALLASFGAPSLMALPKEQYGNFATQLRGLGANL